MAKDDENPSELNFRLTIHNRSKIDSGELYIAPQLFFRNTWAFDGTRTKDKPLLERDAEAANLINMTHKKYGNCQMVFQPSPGGFSSGTNEEEEDEEVEDIDPLLLFTDNESNLVKLFNEEKNPSEYTKDAFEEYLVQGKTDAVNPENKGTKACAVYHFKNIPPGEYVTVRYKFTNDPKTLSLRHKTWLS